MWWNKNRVDRVRNPTINVPTLIMGACYPPSNDIWTTFSWKKNKAWGMHVPHLAYRFANTCSMSYEQTDNSKHTTREEHNHKKIRSEECHDECICDVQRKFGKHNVLQCAKTTSNTRKNRSVCMALVTLLELITGALHILWIFLMYSDISQKSIWHCLTWLLTISITSLWN